MRVMKSLKAFVLLIPFAVAACAGQQEAAAPQQDIVDTAVSAGQFNTLVAAVKEAELVDTLKSKGPFTVFAPSDEAFAKLPAGTVENLLKPENKDQLIAVLTYHEVLQPCVIGVRRLREVPRDSRRQSDEMAPDVPHLAAERRFWGEEAFDRHFISNL